jgi:hypothetical protein
MFPRVHVATLRLAAASLACASALACGSADADGPVDTLSRFLETMDRSNLNDNARKDAYAMLDEGAQAALAERAKRAALVTGRDFAPWDMLAPGRFRMRFAPAEHGGMRATVTGDHAVVHVTAEGSPEKVSVPMTRQAGRWRVQLPLSRIREADPILPAAVPSPVSSPRISAAPQAASGSEPQAASGSEPKPAPGGTR